MKILRITAAVLMTLSLSSLALADEEEHEHADIFIGRGATQTIVGGGPEDGPYDLGINVFEGEVADAGTVFVGDDPGFDSNPNAIPAGVDPLNAGDSLTVTPVSFDLGGPTADLFFWDGSGTPTFTPSSATFAITPVAPTPITSADANGRLHVHTPFTIDGGAVLPPVGIYVAALEAQVTGLAPSDPFYVVFGTEGLGANDEELEEFIELGAEAVESIVGVPEPSTLLLVAMTGVFGLVTRRRR